jgi:hypothetical protein
MPKFHQSWTVLPHGGLQKVTENIWCVEGSLPGPPISRTMTVVRLGGGRLIMHSAIALDNASMREIEGWGRPAFLVVPGLGHRLDAKIYKDRYPDLVVMCPPGARKNVEAAVHVDRSDFEFHDPDVTWQTLDGTGGREGVLMVRSTSGTTLILNDTMMNMAPIPGFKGRIPALMGFIGPAKLPPLPKLLLVKDKAALGAHFERLSTTPDLRRIVVSHGAMVVDDPAAALHRLAGSL